MKNLVLLTCILCLFACQEADVTNNDVVVVQPTTPSFDFDAPANFDWSVHKVVDVEVIIADQYNGAYNYFVEIYHEPSDKYDDPVFSEEEDADGNRILLNPSLAPQLLDKGILSGKKTYKTKVTVLKDSKTIDITQVDPNGNRAMVTIPITGSSVSFDFSSLAGSNKTKSMSTKSILTRTDPNKAPTVPVDAQPIPSNGQLKENTTYLIKSGETKNVTLADGVKLYVEGSCILGSLEGMHGQKITGEQIDLLAHNAQLYILGGGVLQNIFLNLGEGTDLYNYGTVKVTWFLYFWRDNIMENYGEISTNGLSTHAGVNKFTNHNKMTHQSISLQADTELINNGYLKSMNLYIAGNSTMEVGTGAMTRVENGIVVSGIAPGVIMKRDSKIWAKRFELYKNSFVRCDEGEYNSVIITNQGYTQFMSKAGSKISGNLVVDDRVRNNSTVSNSLSGIIVGNPGYTVISIPITEFNDGGYNPTFSGDPDDNPVPSDKIEYFEPIYKVAFEDNFPEKGDNDMNDLVFTWQLGTQKNLDNEIVRAGVRISVMAIGASKQIASAMKIVGINNVSSAQLTKTHDFNKYFVAENGLEAENTDIVVPLFENAHTLLGAEAPQFVNVGKIATVSSYDFDVELNFTNPIESISFENFDFFIVLDGNQNRRTEIHTFGGMTTPKASNVTDFAADSKVVYGISVSSNFKHSMEAVSIVNSYDEFTAWVTSGGISNPKWFNSPNEESVSNPLK